MHHGATFCQGVVCSIVVIVVVVLRQWCSGNFCLNGMVLEQVYVFVVPNTD